MTSPSPHVQKFFADFEHATQTLDLSQLASLYSDPFMFANAQGAQPVKMDDLLKVIPRRQGFFTSIGLVSSSVRSLDETRLDDTCLMVKAVWIMRYQKDSQPPILNENPATYIPPDRFPTRPRRHAAASSGFGLDPCQKWITCHSRVISFD